MKPELCELCDTHADEYSSCECGNLTPLGGWEEREKRAAQGELEEAWK